MANTKSSEKRAGQNLKRNAKNQTIRTLTRGIIKSAMDAIQTKDVEKAKAAYALAVKALSRAASKAAIPKVRAARKISRLTHFLKKQIPAALAAASTTAKK